VSREACATRFVIEQFQMSVPIGRAARDQLGLAIVSLISQRTAERHGLAGHHAANPWASRRRLLLMRRLRGTTVEFKRPLGMSGLAQLRKFD